MRGDYVFSYYPRVLVPVDDGSEHVANETFAELLTREGRHEA